ncbi:MAG: acyl-CoA dehydrogenase family protein [Burkholderiaceae bacterium]
MKLFDQLERERGFSGDETLILDQVRRICAEVIAPNAARYDAQAAYPEASMAAVNELGLNGLFLPEAYGGSPVRFAVYLEAVKMISEACASTGIIYATNCHGMKPLVDFGTEAQKQRLLPAIAQGGLGSLAITESDAGSDATGMKTRFRDDGDDIIIDGRKIFISNGDRAERILLFGKWSGIDDPKAAISALIVERDTPGFSVGRVEDKMGHRAAPTVELLFDGARVPRANLLGEPGDGLRILLASLNKSRPSVAAHALGIATAAFRDMVGYMNERVQSRQRVIDFQGNQFMLADLATDLAMAERWLDYVGELVEQGAADFGLEASIAKMRASDLAMHGGYGYCRDHRVERLMRDAKITQIWEGTNQIHRQLIGRSFRTR